MARYYGPRYGQTDKWGKPKCTTRTYANGGVKRTKNKPMTNRSSK